MIYSHLLPGEKLGRGCPALTRSQAFARSVLWHYLNGRECVHFLSLRIQLKCEYRNSYVHHAVDRRRRSCGRAARTTASLYYQALTSWDSTCKLLRGCLFLFVLRTLRLLIFHTLGQQVFHIRSGQGFSSLRASHSEQMIDIRSIDLIEEMRGVEELQKEVWGPEDVVPLTHLVAAKEVGGILMGAYDRELLVGFVYGFVGREGGSPVIHSHMLAVKPSYRDHHLGYRLKLAQREAALSSGFTRVTWTFDPLQSRNAHLNFARLGVVADQYKINFYGEESPSPLHRHVGTDRLWVSWLLASRRVKGRLEWRSSAVEQQRQPLVLNPNSTMTLVRFEADDSPITTILAVGLKPQHILIEIPADIAPLQQDEPELARRWRDATRQAFTTALASGYLVEEFYRQSRNGQSLGIYLLRRGKKIEDFI